MMVMTAAATATVIMAVIVTAAATAAIFVIVFVTAAAAIFVTMIVVAATAVGMFVGVAAAATVVVFMFFVFAAAVVMRVFVVSAPAMVVMGVFHGCASFVSTYEQSCIYMRRLYILLTALSIGPILSCENLVLRGRARPAPAKGLCFIGDPAKAVIPIPDQKQRALFHGNICRFSAKPVACPQGEVRGQCAVF